jgi:putative acetyltransferase
MIILIGGFSHTGKTYIAQMLLEKYKYPYLSIDHLKMGLYRANINCGFTPSDSYELIGEKLWEIIKGLILTAIENKQNLIIEGWYLLPQKVNELEEEYRKNIISFYLGFSKSYIEKYFISKILQNRNIIETRGYENDFTLDDFIGENMKQKELCHKYGAKYFEIDEDYQKEIEKIYSWIESQQKLKERFEPG